MRRHIGNIAIGLVVSGCAANGPSRVDIATTQNNIAQLEAAADASCPVSALQIHLWADKARQAIANDNGAQLAIAQSAMSLAITSCENEKANPKIYAFDPGAVAQLKRTGSASLHGEAFLRQRGGGIVTCAGETVTLLADSALLESALPNLSARASLPADVSQMLTASVIHISNCDAQGRFAFSGLVPGKYVILTKVQWEVGDEPQGGPVHKFVEVVAGDNQATVSD